MGFVFRKSFKVAPGVRLNVSKKGMGVSVGGRNTPRVSVNSSGRVTKSVRLAPGLRYQETSTLGKKNAIKSAKSITEQFDSLQPETQQEVFEAPPIRTTSIAESESQQVPEPINSKELWLPHNVTSLILFALVGYISATQESFPPFGFFVAAVAVALLCTHWSNKRG